MSSSEGTFLPSVPPAASTASNAALNGLFLFGVPFAGRRFWVDPDLPSLFFSTLEGARHEGLMLERTTPYGRLSASERCSSYACCARPSRAVRAP